MVKRMAELKLKEKAGTLKKEEIVELE